MNPRWHVAQFFEIRWWQGYLARRDKSAYLAWKSRYWQDFLHKTGLAIPPGAQVLDAGCGPAGIYMVLDLQMVDAVDPLLERYEKTLDHFSRSDYPGIRFFNCTLEDFAPDHAYDVVFCLNAINHVADLHRCCERLAAATRPGGTLVITVDAHRFRWAKKLFRLVPADILHPHQFDREEYRAILAGHGFHLQAPLLLKKEAIFSYYLFLATKS